MLRITGVHTIGVICWTIKQIHTHQHMAIFTRILKTTMMVILFPAAAYSQWTEVQTSITSTIFDIHFFDSNNGLACGFNSKIIATTDGGNNWTEVTNPATGKLNTMFFVNDNLGFAAGEYGEVLRTTDGGDTWTLVNTTNFMEIRDISFVDENTGYVGGTGGNLYKTTDGGLNWTQLEYYLESDVNFLHFFSATQGIIAGASGSFLSTTDGGVSYTTISNGGTDLAWKDLEFPESNSTAFALHIGSIFKTTDNGQTWTEIDVNGSPQWDAAFMNNSTGITVADDGVINTTTDGVTFDYEFLAAGTDLRTAYILPSGKAFVAGVGGKMYTKMIEEVSSVVKVETNSFMLYPNPSEGDIQIHSEQSIIGKELVVHNAMGQRVHNQIIQSSRIVLPENLTAGLYFVSLSGEEQMAPQPLIKK